VQIAAWVDACIERLQRVGAHVVASQKPFLRRGRSAA
jgi:hypothetical protein